MRIEYLLLVQLADEIVASLMGPTSVLTWLTWFLVLNGGFVAYRANMRLFQASLLGLPFVMLDIAAAILEFSFGRVEIPSALTETDAFLGFIVSSCLYAAFGMIVAMAGAAIAHFYVRMMRSRS